MPNLLSGVDLLRSYLNPGALRSFFTKSNADRGRERYRRAGLTASTSFLSQTLAILISLVSVPLTVRYLGPERYGVWLTISSLLTWMAMTDFGLAGNALVNVMSQAHGTDDRYLARQYAASAFWALTAITSSIGLVFLLTFAHIPWRSVFRVSAGVSTSELHQACAVTLAVFVLTLPLNMLNSVYNAYQDGFVANMWTISSNLLSLVSLVVVTQLSGGLPQLVFALSGTRVLVGVANAYYLFFHRYPWLHPSPSAVSWAHVKRLLKLGSKYTVTQLASLGIYQSQPMIITQVLGPAQVMIFVIAQRLITLPINFVYMATAPFISAYGEARARGDWNWIRGALKNSVLASLGFGFLMTAPLVLLAKPVIRVWAGAAAVPGTPLVVWLGVYTLLGIAATPAGQMLCGLERVGVLALGLTLCALGTVGLGIVLAHSWGLVGLAVAMSATMVFTSIACQVYEVRRILRGFRVNSSEVEACTGTLSA